MAAGDYRSCDVCGGKAFYDANLNYETATGGTPYRIAGDEQYTTSELTAKYGQILSYVGDWAVICTDCSLTHRTRIEKIEQQEPHHDNP